jgi:predicted aspartyl protease
MSSWRFVLAALAVLLARPAQAACDKRRVALLPLTLWDQKLYVRAAVDGTPGQLFLDTGAGVSTLSKATADSLNLPRDFDHSADLMGVGGAESHLDIVTATLAIGEVRLSGRSFPVARFAERMADGTPVAGLIGADILSRFDLDLDIPHRTLGLWLVTGCDTVTPDWPAPDEGASLEIAPSRHAAVPVRVDGAALQLLLDTGSPGLVLSTRAAARAGAPPEILEQNRALQGSGVNDRPFEARLHIFGRVDIAGQRFGDVRALVVRPGRLQTDDGLLGLELLKRGRVWISYSTKRLFLEAPTGATRGSPAPP